MDFSTKTRKELIVLCQEKGIRGYSGKRKYELILLIKEYQQKIKPIDESSSIVSNNAQ